MHHKGFSMIETMVAMMILVIIGTAIMSLVLMAISANNSAKWRNQGIGLAEEGVEQVRAYFQANGFAKLNSMANSKCYTDGNLTTLVTCPTGGDCATGQVAANAVFYRYVALTQPSGAVKAQTIVSWKDRGVCRSTEVGEYFYSY